MLECIVSVRSWVLLLPGSPQEPEHRAETRCLQNGQLRDWLHLVITTQGFQEPVSPVRMSNFHQHGLLTNHGAGNEL